MSYIFEFLNRRSRSHRWGAPSPSNGEAAGLAFYHPDLEAIGEEVACPRWPDERDRAYAARLLAHLRIRQNQLEHQLQCLLAHCPEG